MNTIDPQLEELIINYVLDTLGEAERRAVEATLTTSAEALAMLSEYQETLTGVAMTAPRQAPPAGMADRFRERLAREADPTPTASSPPNPRIAAGTTQPQHVQPITRPNMSRKRDSRSIRWPAILSAAAAIVVLVGAVYVFLRLSQPDTQTRIAQVINNPAAERFEIPAQAGGSGTVRVVNVPGQIDAVLEVALPTIGADQQYQAWFIREASGQTPQVIMSGGVFDVPVGEPGRVLMAIPDPSRSYVFGITIEPRGGSEQPTSTPIFLGALKLSEN